MKRVRAAMLVVCVAVGGTLAGCSASTIAVPPETARLEPLPVLTGARARGLVSLPWFIQGSAGSVDVPSSGCASRLRGVTVTITSTSAVVAVLGEPASPAPRCAATATVGPWWWALVRLPAAAAGHAIVHAPVTTG